MFVFIGLMVIESLAGIFPLTSALLREVRWDFARSSVSVSSRYRDLKFAASKLTVSATLSLLVEEEEAGDPMN